MIFSEHRKQPFLAAFAVVVAVGQPAAMAADNYALRFEGAPEDVEPQLRLLSSLALEKRDFLTTAAIRQAGREDLRKISDGLHAAGYYAATVNLALSAPESADGRVDVAFRIDAGPKFVIAQHQIRYVDAVAAERPTSLQGFELTFDTNSAGATLQQNQQKLLNALWETGFGRARITGRRVEARLSEGVADAVYEFETGPHMRFGELQIEGADRTDEAHIRKLITWEDGELYERSKLVKFQEELANTGIFSSIDVEAGAPDESGAAPVLLSINERKRRTVGAGLSYSTVEGPGGRLFLEYRNLFGAGEKVRSEIEASEIRQSIAFSFSKPLPKFPGAVYAELVFENETTDVYDARSFEVSGGFSKRWLDDRLTTTGGVAFETSKLETAMAEERNYFISTPLNVVWSTEKDPLTLDRGERIILEVTPYTGSDTFTQTELQARSRISFGDENRFMLAGRARLGATFGSGFTDLPVNKRFYAGGGASVRGYDYQAIGPQDVDGVPTGGRSVIEGAVEARIRAFNNIQFASFVDAGQISQDSLPDFSGDYQIGVGAGIRYLTPIGPIRVDIATPIDPRSTDRVWQLYISLGQPF